MFSFYFPKAPTGRGTAGPKPKEYTAPQMLDQSEPLHDQSRFDAAATRVDNLWLRPGQKFEYLFDFGDCWWHEGILEAVQPSVSRARYPQVRDSRGTSPLQYEATDE